MRSDPRCVFDTNVLVSALLFDAGKPARAFFVVLRDGEVIVSADVVSEISEVLGREKFRRYVTEEQRERFLQGLLRERRWWRSRKPSGSAVIRKTTSSWSWP